MSVFLRILFKQNLEYTIWFVEHDLRRRQSL